MNLVMVERFDVGIVGGGVGGASLASSLARAGLEVLVLERETVYPDRVRGEWMAPWGVVELQRLGLYERVLAAGGHHLSRHRLCEDDLPAEVSAAGELDLTALVPDVPGPLCIGHPKLCQLLIEEAARSGAVVRRGVGDVTFSGGTSPVLEYRQQSATKRAACRLVVGADGRGSPIRRQLGIGVHRDPTHHLFAGMLVEGAGDWPADLQVIGSAGDVHFLFFPQGGGRMRLYLGYATEQAKRFTGEQGPRAFLDAFRLACVPGSELVAGAEPAGPCNSYPNEDGRVDSVTAPGAVLIGDAAGWNDPIIGQGLSITLRDVRQVRDALLGSREWSEAIFEPHVRERAERMRRLRFSASLISTLKNEFGPKAKRRRELFHEQQNADPSLLMPLIATLVGPDVLPPEAFEESMRSRWIAGS